MSYVKISRIDKTIQWTFILLLMMLAAAWLFNVFSFLGIWQQVFAAVLSVAITALVTKVLLRGQTEAEQERERQSTIFQERLVIYKDFLRTLENVVKDEKIDREEVKQLIFQFSNLSIHTDDNRINDILLRLKECVNCLPVPGESMSEIQTKRFAKNVIRLTRSLKAELYKSEDFKQETEDLNYKFFDQLLDEIETGSSVVKDNPQEDVQFIFWTSLRYALHLNGFKFTKRAIDFDMWESIDDIKADIQYYYSKSTITRGFGFNIFLPVLKGCEIVYRFELKNNTISKGFAWVNKPEGAYSPLQLRMIEHLKNFKLVSAEQQLITNDEWAAYEPAASFNCLDFHRPYNDYDYYSGKDYNSYIISERLRDKSLASILSTTFLHIGHYIDFYLQETENFNSYRFRRLFSKMTDESLRYAYLLKGRGILQKLAETIQIYEIVKKCDLNDEDMVEVLKDTAKKLEINDCMNLDNVGKQIDDLFREANKFYTIQKSEADPQTLFNHWFATYNFEIQGLEVNPELKSVVLDFLLSAAKTGNANAQYFYYDYLKTEKADQNANDGKPLNDEDIPVANLGILASAAENGQPYAMEEYASRLSEEGSDETAVLYFEKAAAHNLSKSQYELYKYYINSEHLNQNLAFYWLRKASRQHHIKAMMQLAKAYATGVEGYIDKDLPLANKIVFAISSIPENLVTDEEKHDVFLSLATFTIAGVSEFNERMAIEKAVELGIDEETLYIMKLIVECSEEKDEDIARLYGAKMQEWTLPFQLLRLARLFYKDDIFHPYVDYEYAIYLTEMAIENYDDQDDELRDTFDAEASAILGICRLKDGDMEAAEEHYNQLYNLLIKNPLNMPQDGELFLDAFRSTRESESDSAANPVPAIDSEIDSGPE